MQNSKSEIRQDLESFIWDVAKEATGVRPRWIDFDAMSIEELEACADSYQAEAEEQYAWKLERQAKAVVAFEKLIADTVAMGAGTRKTALRWLSEDVDLMYTDARYFEYEYDLPYNYLDKKVA